MRIAIIISFLLIQVSVFSQSRLPFQNNEILPPQLHNSSYNDICDYLDTYFEENKIEYDEQGRIIDNNYLKYQRWKHNWHHRLTDGDFPTLEFEDGLIHEKIKLIKTHKPYKSDEVWKPRGPFKRSGLYWGMGRVMAIDFHPTDENTYWVGAAKGGIWKTEDGGQTYTSIGDQLPFNSVTNLVVDKEDPDHILITLGDRWGWWEYSIGIYQTFDGGENWEPTNFTFDLANQWTIFDMQASPVNSKKIYAASADGLYISNDGSNFDKIESIEFPEPSFSATYPRQIAFHPTDDNVAYVSWFSYWDNLSSIFRTEDGGETWTNVTDFDVQSRIFISLATTPVNPDKLVAKFDEDGRRFVRISNDKGNTWIDQPDHNEMDGNLIYLSPTIEDRIYSGYFYIWGSGDNGVTFNKISAWDINNVHVDQWYIRHNPLNNMLYWCNDGGVYSYEEESDVWTELNNTLAITQVYDMSVSQNVPEFMIMGSQDNGGARYNFFSDEWENTNGGDGMTNAMNPLDFKNFYSTYVLGQAMYRTRNSWFTVEEIQDNIPEGWKGEADWLSPFCLNPLEPEHLFAVSKNVYHSKDQGDTWQLLAEDILFGNNGRKIEVSPADGQTVVTIGSELISVSQDYGLSWREYDIPDNNNNITNIDLDPTDAGRMWATTGGFADGKKLYVSEDYGETWANLSYNLPNIPALCVLYDEVENKLYLGTEIGMYISDADEIKWEYMTNGLPFTQVNDLELQVDTRKLFAATYGRGIYELQLGDGAVTSTESLDTNENGTYYPNPSSDIVTINNNDDMINHVQIYNIHGKLVIEKHGAIKQINTDNLSTGIYTIFLFQKDDSTKSNKLVISR